MPLYQLISDNFRFNRFENGVLTFYRQGDVISIANDDPDLSKINHHLREIKEGDLSMESTSSNSKVTEVGDGPIQESDMVHTGTAAFEGQPLASTGVTLSSEVAKSPLSSAKIRNMVPPEADGVTKPEAKTKP